MPSREGGETYRFAALTIMGAICCAADYGFDRTLAIEIRQI
jgi:hypothetical protein